MCSGRGSDIEHFQQEETLQLKLKLQPFQESMLIMFDWDEGSVLLFKTHKKEGFKIKGICTVLVSLFVHFLRKSQ